MATMAEPRIGIPGTRTDGGLEIRAEGSARLVSIVILNYNYGRYLTECIESVLSQEYEPIELIVVDDGSTDDSRGILDSYSGRLIASFKKNGGMVTAMNHGFALSQGAIVIFVDADDYLLPGAVAAHVSALCKPGVVRSQTYMTVVQSNGQLNKRIPGPPAAEGDLQELILERGPGAYVSSPNSGNAWSRGFLAQVFPLPEKVRTIGSETFLMDAAPLFGKVVTLNGIKAAYRLHDDSMSGVVVGFTPENIQKVCRHHETRVARLEEIATSLGHAPSTSDWRASNWRFLTLDYLCHRLSGKNGTPGLVEHLRSTFKVRNPVKSAVVASVVLGIRILPTKLSLRLASQIIQLRYM
jgi:glycosyltransferase involved in cell wall biosynthesis